MRLSFFTIVLILGSSTAFAGTSVTCTQSKRGDRNERDVVQTARLVLNQGKPAQQRQQRKDRNVETQTRGDG